MLQLYFTSSQIPSRQFLSFEELFKVLSPREVLFVFDTNIVVYCRDFFLNPAAFENRKELFQTLEYLVDNIQKYDLEVNSSIGNDESSRSKNDFSINADKARQTQMAMQYVFRMNKQTIHMHAKSGFKQAAITTTESFSNSKIDSLKQSSTFSGILTLSYVCVLKIYILYKELESGKIYRRKAYLDFLDFAMDEADGIAVTILSFASHLFGGINVFKGILFTKGSASSQEKLHQLFNGSLDLIYPYIVNRAQDYFPIPNSDQLAPILVTADRRLSMLHSICNTHFLLETDKMLVSEDLPLAQLAFFEGENTKWTKEDNDAFKERTLRDMAKRYASATGPQKTTDHQYPLIEKHERIVWELFNFD